ncbi:MAG: glycosyltransferase [Vicinamibacterales bacterium]
MLPSRSEGQPLAVLEAFCDGVPVIASRIPELDELTDSGATGWLFDPGDATALATMLSAAAHTPERLKSVALRAQATYQNGSPSTAW